MKTASPSLFDTSAIPAAALRGGSAQERGRAARIYDPKGTRERSARAPATGVAWLALLAGLLMFQNAAAGVTFTNTPAVVSNTYSGFITLQIGGLTNGETVLVQMYLDANANGVIDAGDWLVQQFQLTDGQASMIGGAGGVTNINVPGDTTPADGAITAHINVFESGTALQMPGNYLYRLSSPSGRFAAVTNLFSVTNLPFSQSITGRVVCGGASVPGAVVMAFNGTPFNSSPVGGTTANNAGGYSLPLPVGTYNLVAFNTNCVANLNTAPQVVLNSGATVSTNFSLVPGTNSISGSMVNATNSSIGLPGIWIFPMSGNNLLGVAVTDPNGNFTAQVTAGVWKMSYDDMQLPPLGYVRVQSRPQVDTTAGSVAGVTLALPSATALFYGTVKDASGNPLPGVGVDAYDSNSNLYDTTSYSDANGNYAVGVIGGLVNDPWQAQAGNGNGSSPANYIYTFSQPSFDQNGGSNLAAGQAMAGNFVGVQATNQISGYLKDANKNPISGINVWAQATINGASFNPNTDTDATGYYALNVCNGAWTVGVCWGGGGDCLSSQYLPPNSQAVVIAGTNATVSFTAFFPTSQINGTVMDTGSNAIANVEVDAYMPGGGNSGSSATTDGGGNYSLAVGNGTWNVNLSCCGNNSLGALGYLCVGSQSTTVSNSTNTLDFTVPRAPYQISGYLTDASNNPIPYVSVYGGNGTYSACATTATNGFYTLYVTNGGWNVNLDCNALNSLGYLCPGGQLVMVSGSNVSLPFTTVQAPWQITGSVTNSSNQPFANLDVYASATIGGQSYTLDSLTDTNGNFSFQVANGQWDLSVNCGELGGGYLCPNDVTISIAGAGAVTNFVIQPCAALQILTTSLPAGQTGSPYDTYLLATSCNPNFNWGLANGSGPVPPGLQLESWGELHGTPGTNGTFNFTVQVTDGNDNTTNQTLSLTINPAPGDVLDYFVMKMESFRQLDPTNVVPDTNNGPFTAVFGIVQSSLDSVPIANVDLPSGAVDGFPPGSSGMVLQTYSSFPSQAELDAAYPNGNYTFEMATVDDGFQFPVLTMPTMAYPTNPPPSVSNFAAAQAINPLNPFILRWSNPSDATANDYIWVFITNASGNIVFSTPEPATNPSTALTGTNTSVVVPANSFQPGAAYTGVITFIRNSSINFTAYPGAAGLTLVSVRTRFPMAAPAVAPVVSQPARMGAGQFRFLLSGISGQTYTILTSTNVSLPLAEWVPILVTNLSASSAIIQDTQATNKQRFYRVKLGQ